LGYAYTPDGKMIDYNEYVNSHPYWQKVRQARFDFDSGKCAVCHCDLHGQEFQTHHLTYIHLGSEHLTDVITLCPKHHTIFHNNWARQSFWKGKEEGHWEVFDLYYTAVMCSMYYKQDRFICKDMNAPNLCNKDVQRQIIDEFTKKACAQHPLVLDPNDLGLFVRNKRYELFFEAESRGLTVEQFLDEYFGEKVRGQNPIRVEAGKTNGPFDHTPESFHRHYNENKNILKLMEEAKKYE